MAWRERWLAVILVRSFMARPVRGRHEHAGDEARQDIERRAARRLVEVFPGYRRKAWRKRAHRQIGRVEKGQIQLHGGSPYCGVDSIGRPRRASTRWHSLSKSASLPRERGAVSSPGKDRAPPA